MAEETFKDFIEDQLSGIEGLVFKSMFGGWGIYAAEQFFGIVFKGKLYFKTDKTTKLAYKKLGMKPFKPSTKQTLKNYYQVPVEILENRKELQVWAIESAGV